MVGKKKFSYTASGKKKAKAYAKKKYFCHNGKEGSCFDNYCELNNRQHKEQHEKRLPQDGYW